MRQLAAALLCIAALNAGGATAHDGQHDFDFNFGTWKTHIRRLQKPLTGSTSWVEIDGVVTVRPVWNGRANLEEIDAAGFRGLTLRMYNAETHQWNLTWANAGRGTVTAPIYGEFRDGRGEFVDQETLDGRTILVRQIYSDITPDSYHFEQAYSADRGRTYESNFVADLTRTDTKPVAQSVSAEDRDRSFDFNYGRWKTHVSRLKEPLTGSTTWVEYDGTSNVAPVWNGRASLFELDVNGSAGRIQGMGLRLFNPETKEWSLNWANSRDNALGVPTVGGFQNGRGEFVDQELFGGRAILVRNTFTNITPASSRFEQAFSADGGATWETNWIMTFAREEEHDGAHDFDFEIGKWNTHLRRLTHPLSGSNEWIEMNGTTTVRKVWDGHANLVELVVDGGGRHLEGLSLRLYNPETKEWSLHYANAASGEMMEPTVGGFHEARGEFYDRETFDGRPVLVRFGISDIKPNSVHFEQAFSTDEGRTWEVNWVADDVRVDH